MAYGKIASPQPMPPSGVWEEIQPFIDGLAEQAAFISKDGIILAVNQQWRRQVERQARSGLHISRDYDAYLSELVAGGDERVRPILQAFRDIRTGARTGFECLYKGSGPFSGYDFRVVITAIQIHDERYILVTVHDVTEIASLKRQKRRLGSQLLHAQEAERRRLARDLHDSTAQTLVALQLSIGRLSREVGPDGEALVNECQEAIQQIHREIRALSFLAHPPSSPDVGSRDSLEKCRQRLCQANRVENCNRMPRTSPFIVLHRSDDLPAHPGRLGERLSTCIGRQRQRSRNREGSLSASADLGRWDRLRMAAENRSTINGRRRAGDGGARSRAWRAVIAYPS